MTIKKLKVLDLCAGTQSVAKSGNYDYIGVDIESPEGENIIFDLTQPDIVKRLIRVLPKGWKPDYIWASPPCKKVSQAVTGKGGNAYFKVDKEKGVIIPRKDFSIVKHNGMNKRPELWGTYHAQAKISLKIHENILKIIKYFNVPFSIENPANALSRFIYKEFYKNVSNYCMYGFDYKKKTAIYTIKPISIQLCNKDPKHRHLPFDRINKTDKWPTHWNPEISTYSNRSSVPPELIGTIIRQCLKGVKDE